MSAAAVRAGCLGAPWSLRRPWGCAGRPRSAAVGRGAQAAECSHGLARLGLPCAGTREPGLVGGGALRARDPNPPALRPSLPRRGIPPSACEEQTLSQTCACGAADPAQQRKRGGRRPRLGPGDPGPRAALQRLGRVPSKQPPAAGCGRGLRPFLVYLSGSLQTACQARAEGWAYGP